MILISASHRFSAYEKTVLLSRLSGKESAMVSLVLIRMISGIDIVV